MVKAGEPLYVQPGEYTDRRDTELQEWGQLIELYEGKAEQQETEAEVAAYYDAVEALRAKHKKARRMLQDLKSSEGGGWQDLKATVDDAFAELEKAVERLNPDTRRNG